MGSKLTGYAFIPKDQLLKPDKILKAHSTLATLAFRAQEYNEVTKEFYGVHAMDMSLDEITETEYGDFEFGSIGMFCADTFIATTKQWIKNGWLLPPVTVVEVWADADYPGTSNARVIRIFSKDEAIPISTGDIVELPDDGFRLLHDIIESP